ncbi:ATP-grasp fold amidoligase family protein [Sporosarcina thermotolerans]|uniref:ATP-grasp fold amidoligase family protein n=1 Tax=Sporosarcina thermotolerans TaxID=633404 RepID=A0AAW9A8U8_9BACL|nr:ATP-grasp fold amidoligase family protein [Sporosarcina thermotolerans]MDW0116305.1 ATP-grasp fold amidoligase family protein [Sporosarcina thermotolerans]
MSLKKYIKPSFLRRIYGILDLLPDEIVLKLQYRVALGRRLNIKNPERFTEKIQWYKMNYRIPLMTQCADKYRMRDYVLQKGFSEYLPTLYQVCDKFEEIEFMSLPESFAIKCNNGSGTNIFIEDKSNMDISFIKNTINSWSKVNTLSIGREWAYKDIPQKIVIEELLDSNDNEDGSLNDYKILCFNKKAKLAWVDTTRHVDHRRNFYDLEWNQLQVVSDCPTTENTISKPYGFEKMIEIAECFAADFPFVRVDFYSVNGKVYIGEITFYPWSGCVQFTPDKFDYELGKSFNLPPITN